MYNITKHDDRDNVVFILRYNNHSLTKHVSALDANCFEDLIEQDMINEMNEHMIKDMSDTLNRLNIL